MIPWTLHLTITKLDCVGDGINTRWSNVQFFWGGVFDSVCIATFQITGVGLKQPRARPRPLHLVAWGELVKKANLHSGTCSVVRNLVVSLQTAIAAHPPQLLVVFFFVLGIKVVAGKWLDVTPYGLKLRTHRYCTSVWLEESPSTGQHVEERTLVSLFALKKRNTAHGKPSEYIAAVFFLRRSNQTLGARYFSVIFVHT